MWVLRCNLRTSGRASSPCSCPVSHISWPFQILMTKFVAWLDLCYKWVSFFFFFLPRSFMVVVLFTFLMLWWNNWKNTAKEEEVYFASQASRMWGCWSHCNNHQETELDASAQLSLLLLFFFPGWITTHRMGLHTGTVGLLTMVKLENPLETWAESCLRVSRYCQVIKQY